VTDDYVNRRYPLSDLTSRIIAAAHEVHHQLGPGFREIIYQRALERELPQKNVEFEREVWIDIIYKGQKIGRHRVDFVVGDAEGGVMLELKAKALLDDVDFIQTLSYLKSSGYEVGLLINFGGKKLEVRRLANSRKSIP
jgi:GxxExxY protein